MRLLIVAVWEYILSPHAILRILPPSLGWAFFPCKSNGNRQSIGCVSPWQRLTSKAKVTVISLDGLVPQGGYVCMGGIGTGE